MLARQRVVWMCIVGATACFVLALQRIAFQNQYWTNFSKWPFPNTIEMHLIFFTIKEHLYALWSAKKNKSVMHFKGNCQSFTIHIGEGVLIMDHNKRFFFHLPCVFLIPWIHCCLIDTSVSLWQTVKITGDVAYPYLNNFIHSLYIHDHA